MSLVLLLHLNPRSDPVHFHHQHLLDHQFGNNDLNNNSSNPNLPVQTLDRRLTLEVLTPLLRPPNVSVPSTTMMMNWNVRISIVDGPRNQVLMKICLTTTGTTRWSNPVTLWTLMIV